MARPAAALKRIVKLSGSILVRLFDVIRNAVLKIIGRAPPPQCTVIYYHAVKKHLRERFARQMDDVRRLTLPVRADIRQPLNAGRNYTSVTFDDAFVSVFENAIPEMEARNIPAVIFVPTGSLGGRPAWIKDPNYPGYEEQVASPEQLSRWNDHQLVLLESHSISHPNFLKLTEAEAKTELARSKEDLERITRKPVKLFSFPHGKFNSRLVELAREAGYERIFGIEPSLAFRKADEVVTGRVAVEPTDWPIEFRLKILGAYRWLAAAN